MKEQRTALVMAIITLLITTGLGANEFLNNPDELENHYVCDLFANEERYISVFNGGLSASKQRGYPFTESRKGYIDCKKDDTRSEWIQINKYAEMYNISAYDLIIEEDQPISTGVWGKSYKCNQVGCTEK